jgi:hypothetical protein
MSAAVEKSESIPVIAVTAAVGAVVLLFVLLCSVGRQKQDEQETGDLFYKTFQMPASDNTVPSHANFV